MEKLKPHLPDTLKSSVAYGLGFGLTILITDFLYQLVDSTGIGLRIPPELLFIGIGIALFIEALGSGVGGAIGALTLPLPQGKQLSSWGKAWRGGFSMGLVFSLVLFVWILILFLLSFYGRYDLDSLKFSSLFALAGSVFGVLFGWLLGLLLVRGHGVWQVALASLVGFGLGGFGLGEFLRRYLLTIESANLISGNRILLVFGFIVFGLGGGAALGFIFSRLSQRPYTPRKIRWWQWAIITGVLFLSIWVLSPILTATADMLTPIDADLDTVIELTTTGTHWADSFGMSDIVSFTGSLQDPVIAANESGQLAQAWLQVDGNNSKISWLAGEWDGEEALWQTPINFSRSPGMVDKPALVIDSSGMSHIVWQEENMIHYSQCRGNSCAAPVVISEAPSCAADVSIHGAPILGIDKSDNLMAVWQGDKTKLLYRSWPVSVVNPSSEVGCVPTAETGVTSQSRVDGGSDQRFALVYVVGDDELGTIQTITYADGKWENHSIAVGGGNRPNVFIDGQDEIHLTWCASENEVHYAVNEEVQTIPTISCDSHPEIIQDSEGVLHIIWFGDKVVNVNGIIRPQTVLYESTNDGGGWANPAIIGRTDSSVQPSVAATETHLHLIWPDDLGSENDIEYASFIPYSCEDYPLSGISQVAYDVARKTIYRPSEDIIPYCQNQVHQLVYMPNPDPAFSDGIPYPNGGFDVFAELAQTAQHEVLFTTMWYEADQNNDSPGYVLAESVAALYKNLKANPEQYPRGLTVRILTGNPPQLNMQPFSDQPFSVLADLRNAGVDKMVDPDIGWRVEVADFEGAMPHSHTKFMVVDGRSALIAGFNMEYVHYPTDHPSDLGKNKQDLGILVSGPVAQNAHRTFNDLWEGSPLYTCDNFYPAFIPWQLTCRKETATADHVPEVHKYYLPAAESSIFSMYRSKEHDEADRMVESSLGAAQNRVDAMHTMFSMEMVCDLNLLFELCDFGEATDYLQGLMQAAENGAAIRLIISPIPLNGIENAVAYDVFVNELEDRGLRDQVEIRFLEDYMHYKTALIDDEFLIIGSQNFHYSAYGDGDGLSEYSLGTDDLEAIKDYKRLFDYQWKQSTQR